MGKKKKKPENKVLPTSPASPETSESIIEDSALLLENPTLTPAETEDAASEPEIREKIVYRKDPRYEVLLDALKQLRQYSPSFDSVKENPWLYLELLTKIDQLVQ